jgi:hypothetical protein
MTFLPVERKFRFYWVVIAVAFAMCTSFFYNNFYTGFFTILAVALLVEPVVEGGYA